MSYIQTAYVQYAGVISNGLEEGGGGGGGGGEGVLHNMRLIMSPCNYMFPHK